MTWGQFVTGALILAWVATASILLGMWIMHNRHEAEAEAAQLAHLRSEPSSAWGRCFDCGVAIRRGNGESWFYSTDDGVEHRPVCKACFDRGLPTCRGMGSEPVAWLRDRHPSIYDHSQEEPKP